MGDDLVLARRRGQPAGEQVRVAQAGTLWVNCDNVVGAAPPSAATKESDRGREMGAEAVTNHLETKCVTVQL